MAEEATLARPYANAAFDIAKSARNLEEWSKALNLLAVACEQPEMSEVLGSPVLATEVKASKIIALFDEELSASVRRFIQLLAENKRLSLLGEITLQFETKRAEEERTLDVTITTAVDLTAIELEKFSEALTRHFDQEINLLTEVDAELLGGAIVRTGDTVIDGSVRGKLDKLGEALARA